MTALNEIVVYRPRQHRTEESTGTGSPSLPQLSVMMMSFVLSN